jgi:alpha-tubulin suppressor-like RCC1 family protein
MEDVILDKHCRSTTYCDVSCLATGGYASTELNKCQTSPHVVGALSINNPANKSRHSLPYICKKVAAGSRHTLFLMIHCRKAGIGSDSKKRTKVMMSGLNQGLLCEEEGYSDPVDIHFEDNFKPVDVTAGRGVSFVVDRYGNVFSFGLGQYGVLGHGNEETNQVPRQIGSLLRQRVKKVCVGDFHAAAVTYTGKIFTWGRNHRGQLGRGFESDSCECVPAMVAEFAEQRYFVSDIACGDQHCVAIVTIMKQNGTELSMVYAWGDDTNLQIGSCDTRTRSTPNEIRWLTKFLTSKLDGAAPYQIAAGGGHNLLLTSGLGRVVSWGAGGYGQLGHGDSWDCAYPRVIKDLVGVISVHAGKRHSAAIVQKPSVENEERKKKKRDRLLGIAAEASIDTQNTTAPSLTRSYSSFTSPPSSPSRKSYSRANRRRLQKEAPKEIQDDEHPREHVDVLVWGYNSYGELGLGDLKIRMIPTRVTALQSARARTLSLGDRHSVVVTDHVPMLTREVPDLKPFFDILKVSK